MDKNLRAPATLSHIKFSILTGQKRVWFPQPVWKQLLIDESLSLSGIEPNPTCLQPLTPLSDSTRCIQDVQKNVLCDVIQVLKQSMKLHMKSGPRKAKLKGHSSRTVMETGRTNSGIR